MFSLIIIKVDDDNDGIGGYTQRSNLQSRYNTCSTQFYNMNMLYSIEKLNFIIYNFQLRYNMDVLYSIEDLIAAFGGLFGLCTGASLLRSCI